MTHLLFASALLAASLAADPAPAKKEAAKPAAAAAEKAPAKKTAPAAEPKKEAPVAPVAEKKPASPEALKDATRALRSECPEEFIGGKVTAVEVLNGTQLNARLEKEKSTKPKAEPIQRFIAIEYEAGGSKGKSVRQVSTHFMLTTDQAQTLLGEKLCVISE